MMINDVVTTYESVHHINGWTIVARFDGTRFTNGARSGTGPGSPYRLPRALLAEPTAGLEHPVRHR